jgi:hypothetical protein
MALDEQPGSGVGLFERRITDPDRGRPDGRSVSRGRSSR